MIIIKTFNNNFTKTTMQNLSTNQKYKPRRQYSLLGGLYNSKNLH